MGNHIDDSSKGIKKSLDDGEDGTLPMNIKETPEPISKDENDVLTRPRSLVWRLVHGTNYLLGCLGFVAASTLFLDQPRKQGPEAMAAGGWLYTLGSLLFLLADLQEWWYYRIGCCCYRKYQDVYEKQNGDLFCYKKGTILGNIRRAEVGLNFFLSACGSILYLSGSILFIPGFEAYVVTGLWLVISASSVVVVSQSWKLYRCGCTSQIDPNDHRFHFVNLVNDVSCLLIDVCSGLGGAFFLMGTSLFLPQNYTDCPLGNNRAAGLCLCGSIFFTLAGLVIHYRHYCLSKPLQCSSSVL